LGHPTQIGGTNWQDYGSCDGRACPSHRNSTVFSHAWFKLQQAVGIERA